MTLDIADLRPTTLPKSTQLNADQLVVGPMDITITDVRLGSDEKQPIIVHYENQAGRPFMPCLTMRRVLMAAWGFDGREWIGKSLRVFHDPQVRFGGEDVGGVRISHMTDIPGKRIELKLTASKGKKTLYVIERMEPKASGPTRAHVLQLIATAANNDDMKAAKAAAQTLSNPEDAEAALAAYKARVTALKARATTAAQPTFVDQIAAAQDLQTLQQIGEAMDSLPDGDEKEALAQALLQRENEIAPKE
jgi:hypothetical protein